MTWCGREDLNLHPLQDYHLKVARLPIPPRPRLFACKNTSSDIISVLLENFKRLAMIATIGSIC